MCVAELLLLSLFSSIQRSPCDIFFRFSRRIEFDVIFPETRVRAAMCSLIFIVRINDFYSHIWINADFRSVATQIHATLPLMILSIFERCVVFIVSYISSLRSWIRMLHGGKLAEMCRGTQVGYASATSFHCIRSDNFELIVSIFSLKSRFIARA